MHDHFETGPLALVVAGDLTHRSIVSRMVRTLGFRVRSCGRSQAALHFMREHPREVHLLLADLALERMDGGELAERARDLNPHLDAVLMASPTDPHIDELLDGYPDLPFVAKPVSFAALAAVLHDHLAPIGTTPSAPPYIARSSGRL